MPGESDPVSSGRRPSGYLLVLVGLYSRSVSRDIVADPYNTHGDAPPLASATAFARTPLFAHLGRIDLAKLAGELEERRFRAGETPYRLEGAWGSSSTPG
jgi:hypothetical protein